MTSTARAKTGETPVARQKRVWDRAAPGYDRQIAFFEKAWFGGGREWGRRACPGPSEGQEPGGGSTVPLA
jgi:hypothetical protein